MLKSANRRRVVLCASLVGALSVGCWSGTADATSCPIDPRNPLPVDGASDVPTNVVPTFRILSDPLEDFEISLVNSETGEPVDITVALVDQAGAHEHVVVTPLAELEPHTTWTLDVVEPVREGSLTVQFTTGEGPDHDAPAVPVLERTRRHSTEFTYTLIPPEPVAYVVEVASDEGFSDAVDVFLTSDGHVFEGGEIVFRVGTAASRWVPSCDDEDIVLDNDQVWTRVAAVSAAGVISEFSEPENGSRLGCASVPGRVGAMWWLALLGVGLTCCRRRTASRSGRAPS